MSEKGAVPRRRTITRLRQWSRVFLKRTAVTALALIFAAGAFANRNDIVEGNPTSPVKVLIYEDLQCSDCARFRALLDEKILPRYGSKVAFIHRDFPLGKHDWARASAIAARWVSEQSNELGITCRREMLAEQDNITSQNLKQWLIDFAYRNHVDPKGIVDSLSDQRLGSLVDQDRQAAVARGVTRTPTAFVGGQAFVETIIYEDLARALDAALAK
jgi:protein-disulfide isomerase